MIIDLILDRKYDDELIAQGYTHTKYPNGELRPLEYDPRKFYNAILQYISEPEDHATKITRAMDVGTEQDVKDALCAYVTGCNYNPDICDYINSRNWLTEKAKTDAA